LSPEVTKKTYSIFGTADPRDLPSYTYAQASRILRIPAVTLRAWVAGTTYSGGVFDPVIRRPNPEDSRLSFANLVEAHVLRSLRTRHGVPMNKVREALAFAEQQCGIERLLTRKELKATPGRIFFDEYGKLTELSKGGQLGLREVWKAHLELLVHDVAGFPIRLFPWTTAERGFRKSIVVDPLVSFGNPITVKRAISTAVLADRFDAGEPLASLARDYSLTETEVQDAIVYERAA